MSSGVRNLRAMFEQNAASSPEPRGRSPGSSSAVDDTSRPTSKVRASFVSVEHTIPHASDFTTAATKGAPSNSTAANRRESFSISEDTAGEVAELKKAISGEKEERRKSAAIIEPVPEQAIASRESSAGPPPVRNEPEGEMVNLGTIMKGSDFPETSAEKSADAPQQKEAPAPELPSVKEEPVKEEVLAPALVQEAPVENPDKVVTGAQEEAQLRPANPTDASAVSDGQALTPPVEESQPVSTEADPTTLVESAVEMPEPVVETPKPVVETPKPVVETPELVVETPEPVVETPKPVVGTPKPAVNSNKVNGTPTTKGRLEPKKPAAVSTTKASASKSTPLKSPLPKAAPKTPTNSKHSTVAPVSKSAAAAKPAAKPAASKDAPKAVAPKPKTSHTSLRVSTATAPTATAKAKTVITENKKPAITKSNRDATATSPTGFKKPKPKSPTRPVGLPSRLTAPTAASAAKLQGEEAQKVTRKPTTTTRSAPKPAVTRPSRPSVAPSASTNKRPESRTSTAGTGSSFLERMSRPTAASASKIHEKPASPPRKAPAKTSILQKGKKKVEEVAAKAKEVVTTDSHADESTKTEPANGTDADTEHVEKPVAEPVAEKADQPEPSRVETPVPEGESSAMELQTPNFQGEAVR